ncbi:hypothetical protein [Clostridium cylindrosporum]|uniref:Uncharacterized protein n=1 Tax=Clostridium cylindrosporum DSM 605 TaxID=1121307 RepID=A0A0J8DBY6_CLOCY|nr:hypothetical protein [Clostridium cylindrosporum]KMT23382.1 hypothetical protein CLCY_8c01190 [Clostridium cylindrosporum DSM 605]
MDVVVYRAKVQGSYIYDYSLNPKIDYSYLNKFKGVSEIEVITPYLPLYMGKFILRIIKRSISKLSFIIPLKDRRIFKVLKKLNVEKVSLKISEKIPLPDDELVDSVLDSIGDTVVTLDILREKIIKKTDVKELYNCLQFLYLKEKIKINPLYGKKTKNEYCDICDETCEDCFLGYSAGDILIYKNEAISTGGGCNIRYRKTKLDEKLRDYINIIGDFILSRGENLVVLCPPMLRQNVFSFGAIYEVLKSSGRVLYVTSSNDMYSLKKDIGEIIDGANIHVFDGTDGFGDADILICSYTNVPAFKDDFDLSILDDRLAFPQKPYKNIYSVCKRALKTNGKFINISVIPLKFKENLIKGSSSEVQIPPINIENPIPEPKFIISRYIDERTVYLPDISLDMVKWSIREGSNVIIFTPSNRISIYLKNYLTKIEGIKEPVGISSEKNREDYYSFLKGEKTILISSNYIDSIDPIYNINVIVMYSDLEKYSEDVLLYMCSMANNHMTKSFREALFIANEEGENMLRAKSIIRSINKIAWENGYIKE